MKVILDLYSGTGGASEAFLEHPGWRVIRVEDDHQHAQVPETRIVDSSWSLNLLAEERIELLWASFPCTEFSRLDQPWTRARLPEGFEPSLVEALKTKNIIEVLKPKYYCVENVRGAIPYLEPIFGPHTQRIGPYFLWTNLPTIVTGSWNPLKKSQNMTGAKQRGAIPIELSRAVLEATTQPTMEDF